MRRAVMRRQIEAATTLYATPPEPTPAVPPAGGAPVPTPPPTPPVPPNPTPRSYVDPTQPAPPNPGETVLNIPQRALNDLLAKEKKQGTRHALRSLAEAAGLDPETVTDEQLKTFLTDSKAARDAALTEEQRRQAALDAREAAVKTRESQAAAALASAEETRRTARREAILTRLGATSSDDLEIAVAFLARAVADDADEAAVQAAAEQLKTTKAALFTGAPVAPVAPPAPGGLPAGGPPPRQTPAVKPGDRGRERAKAMGLAG
ncbi:hypothetical protein OG618_37215 (plasmid) [Kitasatospora sp. NBC_01246]|uniref:hypothetical protein n=1 Tax=Kitasatospora sp. NBC_01246 TaxID=2903570 RepID=UPI002E375C4E|nr:hypothetical protein [Kitasatospora sp. NBC_01246]